MEDKQIEKKQRSLLLWFDRILAHGLIRQILLLVGILFVSFLFSYLLLSLSGDEWTSYCTKKTISKWVFPFYLLTVPDAFNDFCTSELVGKLPVFFACLIYIVGVILFTGMIISVMTNMIERRVENHLDGHIHYLKSGHYVIMGYDDIIPSFIHYIFKENKDAYVLILTSAKVTDVTEKLRKSFNKKEMDHIIINYGHRTTIESYKDIHLEAAEQIFVVGLRSKPAHDAINVECVDTICQYLEKENQPQKPKSITCVFNDLDTYSAFKTTEIFERVRNLGMDFIPYNFYTAWAKQVFVKHYHHDMGNFDNKYDYPSVFGNGITPDDPKYVHLVFVGYTDFAVAFAMEAAQVLHFPNFNKNPELKTRITFIDLHADREKNEFITRNRHFFDVQPYRYQDLSDDSTDTSSKVIPAPMPVGNFLDVEFEFIKGDVFSKQVQEMIKGWANEKEKQYLSIFLTMENQRSNFMLGMNMPDEVYDHDIPIYICQNLSDNFVTNLRTASSKEVDYTIMGTDKILHTEKRHGRYANIYPFGMNETVYTADCKSLKRAKLIHYLYCTADYETFKFNETVLNSSEEEKQKIWKEADELWRKLSVALRWSNLYSSYTIRTKMATLKAMRGMKPTDSDILEIKTDEINELAKVEHNRWNVEKLMMGYRRPKPEEDAYMAPDTGKAKKLALNKKMFIHHDIRPFDTLGAVAELDREFTRYIPWILEMTEEKKDIPRT